MLYCRQFLIMRLTLQLSRLLAVLKEYSTAEFVDRISENEDGDIFNIIRDSKERKGKGDALLP